MVYFYYVCLKLYSHATFRGSIEKWISGNAYGKLTAESTFFLSMVSVVPTGLSREFFPYMVIYAPYLIIWSGML
jgi:hypothetical protein